MDARTYAKVVGVVIVLIGVGGLILGEQSLLGVLNIDIAEDCGRSRNSRWLRSRNSAVGGSVLMFYSLAPFGVEVARPGRLFGR